MVNIGFYEIVNEQSKGALTVESSGDTIVPDMLLSMSILLKRQQEPPNEKRENCLSCEALYQGYGKCPELERVRWYYHFWKLDNQQLIICPHKPDLRDLVPNSY
jgi:hypothetical protein